MFLEENDVVIVKLEKQNIKKMILKVNFVNNLYILFMCPKPVKDGT